MKRSLSNQTLKKLETFWGQNGAICLKVAILQEFLNRVVSLCTCDGCILISSSRGSALPHTVGLKDSF